LPLAFRQPELRHNHANPVLPEVPADNPTTTFATIELKESAPLQAAFHQTTESENVLSMFLFACLVYGSLIVYVTEVDSQIFH